MTKRRIPRRAEHDLGQQNLGLLRYLYRGDSGFVHLQSRPYDRWAEENSKPVPPTLVVGKRRYTGSFPLEIVHDFDSLLPEVRELLTSQLRPDGRASINTAYFPKPYVNQNDFYRLNAVWVDLDCRELEYDEALARLQRLVADKVLPPFSIIMDTGNGLHVFWLLRGDEKDLELPPRAHRRNRTLQADLNRALVARVQVAQPELQPDPSPISVTTHTRVPGSVNTRTNSPVVLTLNVTRKGLPPSYTMDWLRGFLNVPERDSTRRAPGARRPDGTPPDPKKLRGHVRRFEVLLEELELLRAARGGFSGADTRKPKKKRKRKYQLQSLKPVLPPGVPGNVEPEEQPIGDKVHADLPAGSASTSGRIHGHRRRAVYLLALCMKKLKHTPEDIYRAAAQLARECHPPLPQSEAVTAAKSGMTTRSTPPKNVTIAESLGVTLEEANALHLEKIRPDFEPLPVTAGRAKKRKQDGLAALRQLVQKYGPVLPFSHDSLRQELQARPGLNVSRGTIGHWLAEVGAQVAGHRGKYKQPSQQTDLADLLGGTGDGPVN